MAEVQRFISGIERNRLYAPLLLSLMGPRPAEVVGLRWADLDLKLATLEMTNTRTMIGNSEVVEKDAKTTASGESQGGVRLAGRLSAGSFLAACTGRCRTASTASWAADAFLSEAAGGAPVTGASLCGRAAAATDSRRRRLSARPVRAVRDDLRSRASYSL
ncbi:hypothetical protein ACFV2H_14045 [Streptomyces sp. NPDC059629]|uniref:hypothetical protein n=1 Tax=Streptomyces sp. NPDC059629 TaxID=3346889 RepID=UPI0036760501